MCPDPYYTTMRESKDPRSLRLRMVQYAKDHGIKPAADYYHTTPKTVRLWVRRWDGTLESLADHSRAPHRRPRKLTAKQEAPLLDLKRKLPTWSARRLKRDFHLTHSEKTLRRVFRDHGLLRPIRRRKHQTKRCLREVKAQWRAFQQIEVDTKDLCDIPEYWHTLKHQGLPRYQYTARDVTTGLLYLGFSNELSLSYATLFAERICQHLVRCGIDLSQVTWQSDNGSEFIGSWQAKEDSAFTKALEAHPGQQHRTIPPGQHRFQADVETVHSLIETEFFQVERFTGRGDFLQKAWTYQLYFDVARENSGKEQQTPWEILQQKIPQADPRLPMLPPVFLDHLYQQQPTQPQRHEKLIPSSAAGGYDVGALPSRSGPTQDCASVCVSDPAPLPAGASRQ